MLGGTAKTLVGSAFAAAAVAASPAAAQEMTLKFAHVYAATHKQWVQGGGYLAKLLDEASGGKIKFEQYPAGQLGKESATIIGSGLAEAGIATPSYEPDKMPLSIVAELPSTSASSCEGSAKLGHLLKEGGILDEAEMKPLGLHALFAQVSPPYSIVTTTKEVTTIDDVKNLKIRANGAALDATARMLGAVPVSVVASEIFDSLSRGTIDASFLSMEAVRGLSLEKVVKYSFDGARIGSSVTIFVMNRNLWDGLDQPTKDMISKASLETAKHFCSWYDNQNSSDAQSLVDNGSIKLHRPSAEESKRVDELLAGVGTAWAAGVDSTGRPGGKVLEAYRAAPSDF